MKSVKYLRAFPEREGFAASVTVSLEKFSRDYVSPYHGASGDHLPNRFVSGQVNGIIVGSRKSQLLEWVEEYVDAFILKYLEANME